MRKIILLLLVFMLVLSGCSNDAANQQIMSELASLRKETKKLKEEIEALKNGENKDKKTNKDENKENGNDEEGQDSEKDEETEELTVNGGLRVYKTTSSERIASYTIKRYSYQDSYSNKTTDGQFFILEIDVENIGKDEFSIVRDFIVIDSKDRNYKGVNLFKKENDSEKGTLVGNVLLKPGFSTTIFIVFEVPTDFEPDLLNFSYFNLFRPGNESVCKIDLSKLEKKHMELGY